KLVRALLFHAVSDELDHVSCWIIHVGAALTWLPLLCRAAIAVCNLQRIKVCHRSVPFCRRNIEGDMRARHLAAHDEAFRRKRRFSQNQSLAARHLHRRLLKMSLRIFTTTLHLEP